MMTVTVPHPGIVVRIRTVVLIPTFSIRTALFPTVAQVAPLLNAVRGMNVVNPALPAHALKDLTATTTVPLEQKVTRAAGTTSSMSVQRPVLMTGNSNAGVEPVSAVSSPIRTPEYAL